MAKDKKHFIEIRLIRDDVQHEARKFANFTKKGTPRKHMHKAWRLRRLFEAFANESLMFDEMSAHWDLFVEYPDQ